MWEKLCRYFLEKASRDVQIAIARDVLEDIQKSTDYSINNAVSEKIIEAVIKSSGNKITAFILKD